MMDSKKLWSNSKNFLQGYGGKIKKQWQLSLLVLLFLPLLLWLGFWQLERAEEKQQLLAQYEQQRELPVQHFTAITSVQQETNYQSVRLRGQFDQARYWLLDNRSREGQVGYEVVMPLWLEQSEQWVLVNRGWVSSPGSRNQLPAITTPSGHVAIEGHFYKPARNAIFNIARSDLPQAWPKRVLYIDHDSVKQALRADVYPTVLRMKNNSLGAFSAQWSAVNTLPEKHWGYAIQWFAMSLVLLVLYCRALLK